jgi:fructokinase
MPLFGGVELGGTKIVCGIGTSPDDLTTHTFRTTTPERDLPEIVRYFDQQPERPAAIGVGCFGPIDLHPRSPSFGSITYTPKPGWRDARVAGFLQERLSVPVAFDTDVNAAALGEATWGAAQGLTNVLYVTVGTGIGGGALVNGAALHGLVHPEMGHIRVPHDLTADPFPGCCVYHGDCLEGLASGPAIERRTGQRGESLPPDHPCWDLVARYLAFGIVNGALTLSPEKVILGGGVMGQAALFPKIRFQVMHQLSGYLQFPGSLTVDQWIVPPGLGSRSGVLGALRLAQTVHAKLVG